MKNNLIVDGYSERWLRKGFPWVYPKEVTRGERRVGQEVVVQSARGEALGRGLADTGWLAARVYRHDAGPLDQAWMSGVVDRAWALRRAVIDPGTTGYRLIHAENDGLPGVRVDKWGDRLVVALDSPAVAPLLDLLVASLVDRFAPAAIHLCWRPDRRDETDPATFKPRPGVLHGALIDAPVVVTERGLRVRVRPDEGPDVGLYADMRLTRAFMEPLWRDRRVLNTFAYTGMFSVAAAAHGAAEVVTTDLSEKYLSRAKENFALNDLPVIDEAFIADDTFKVLDRYRRKGIRFDVVILDPPSHSHGEGLFSAERDTARLVAAAARVLAPDGLLLSASNLGEWSPHKFRGEVDDGLRKAERLGQELWFGGQSPDFPAGTWFPEGRHLKVGVWRVY